MNLMDELELRVRLNMTRPRLIRDFQLNIIRPRLIEQNILRPEEDNSITTLYSARLATDAQRNGYFLDIVLKKSRDVQINFVTNVLSVDYDWIWEEVREAVLIPQDYANLEAVDRRIRDIDCIRRAATTTAVAQNWESLAHELNLDDEIRNVRHQVLFNQQSFNEHVFHLLSSWNTQRPTVATLGTYVRALRNLHINSVAEDLLRTYNFVEI